MGYLDGHTSSSSGNPKVKDTIGDHKLTLQSFTEKKTESAGNILVATFTDELGNFFDEPFFIDGTGWAARYARGRLRSFVMELVGAKSASDEVLEGTITDLLTPEQPGKGIRINASTRATNKTNPNTGEPYTEVTWVHVDQDAEQIVEARQAPVAQPPPPPARTSLLAGRK